MLIFILRRLLQAIPVVFLASVGVFLMLHLLPGDPAIMISGGDASPQVIEAVREDLGLNKPLPVQYVIWVEHVLRGDLGKSILSKIPVSQLIMQRAPATLELAFAGEILTILIGIPLGVLAAVKQRTKADWGITSFISLGLAIPNFWLGILLIILFAVTLGWMPPGGRGDFSRDPLMALKFIALPAITLALPAAMNLSRLTKASVLEVLYEDYVRTAWAKGLSGKRVVVGHVLRNSLIPVVTAIGLEFGRLLGGAIVVESVFAWPGLGTLMLQSISNRDYVIVQAGLLLLVMVFIVVNLLTDITYGFLDPRIRLSRGRGR
jgi:ABC-type dipeptide/oligopeptide/nickel transport system permease component